MSFAPIRAAVLAPLLLLAGCDSSPTDSPGDGDEPPPEEVVLDLEEVTSGLDQPLVLTAPPGDPRLFVAEQTGAIRIIDDGMVAEAPFLDLSDRISSGGERGLLGVAFHPGYVDNGWFFVNYTDEDGNTRVERFQVSGDPDSADPASNEPVLSIEQPFANHNGGHLAFGPDGMLYISTGDGGSGGDPLGHGQDSTSLLGSILRVDVDTGDAGYTMPADNPLVGDPGGGRGELWAWGLRNPWRFSFDPEEGLFYIADVGQSGWEEVNVADDDEGGINYGWSVMEGSECFQAADCDAAGMREPVLVYPTQEEGCAVIGGYVYRGDAIPGLQGHYLYSDYCAGWLRSMRHEAGEATEQEEWDVPEVGSVQAIGRDGAGELYLLTANGVVYRIVEG